MSVNGEFYDSILNHSLSRETRDVLELGLAALAFGTPAASEAGSIYGSFRNGSIRSVADIPSRTDPRSDPRTEELRRAVKSDLSAFVKEVTGTSYQSERVEENRSNAPHNAVIQQLLEDDVFMDEAALRGKIRQEIKDKMAVMLRQKQLEKGPQSLSPPSRILSPQLEASRAWKLQQETPKYSQVREPTSTGSKKSRDGDEFWKDLLIDLKISQDFGRPDAITSHRIDHQLDKRRSFSPTHGASLQSSMNSSLDLEFRGHTLGHSLDTPLLVAAKRETLLGASLDSECSSFRDPSQNFNHRSSGTSYNSMGGSLDKYDVVGRTPDLTSGWQREIDVIGMMALRNLENQQRKVYGDIALATASYTDTLIQKVEQNQALQRRSAVSPIAQQPRSVPPPEPLPIKTDDLNVKCSIDANGVTANVSWAARWGTWAHELPADIEMTYEVQMVVRWMDGQEWATLFTVSEPTCTVEGLKPSHPFAVRVRAMNGHTWASDYTQPYEFVTQVLLKIPEPTPASQMSYLERIMHERQEAAVRRQQQQKEKELPQQQKQQQQTQQPAEQQQQVAAAGECVVEFDPKPSHEVQVLKLNDPENPHYERFRQLQKEQQQPRSPMASPMASPLQGQLQQRVSVAAAAADVCVAEFDSKPPAAVRLIKLNDPENPHYEQFQPAEQQQKQQLLLLQQQQVSVATGTAGVVVAEFDSKPPAEVRVIKLNDPQNPHYEQNSVALAAASVSGAAFDWKPPAAVRVIKLNDPQNPHYELDRHLNVDFDAHAQRSAALDPRALRAGTDGSGFVSIYSAQRSITPPGGAPLHAFDSQQNQQIAEQNPLRSSQYLLQLPSTNTDVPLLAIEPSPVGSRRRQVSQYTQSNKDLGFRT